MRKKKALEFEREVERACLRIVRYVIRVVSLL
jgi:hypothetical protein